jgi:hypothetical protein
MDRWRQRAVSFVSAAIFLAFLWLLFQKLIVVAWISIAWWMIPLMLIGLFVFIETMVAKTFRAKRPSERAAEKVKSVSKDAGVEIAEAASKLGDGAVSGGADALQAVKNRLAERDRRNAKP